MFKINGDSPAWNVKNKINRSNVSKDLFFIITLTTQSGVITSSANCYISKDTLLYLNETWPNAGELRFPVFMPNPDNLSSSSVVINLFSDGTYSVSPNNTGGWYLKIAIYEMN